MSGKKIKLGDEVEDVVSKIHGIAHGHSEYLDGSEYWIIQPLALENAEMSKEVTVPVAYCRRIGDGVYPMPKPRMGFSAENVPE